jgi:hypothetical protein
MTKSHQDNDALRLAVAEAASIVIDGHLETLLSHDPFRSKECERFFLALAAAAQLRGRQVDAMFTGDQAWFWTLWRADESPTNSGDYTPPPNHIGYTFPADGHNAVRIYSEVRVGAHRADFVVEWGEFHYANGKVYRAAIMCGECSDEVLSTLERMGVSTLRFTSRDLQVEPMACAHELLDHFLDLAEKDGVKSHSRIYARARALLGQRPDGGP